MLPSVVGARRDPALYRRLLSRTYIDPVGCFVWTGPRDRGGYGKITVAGRSVRVHRLAFITFGCHFDPALTLDHLCRNRACWNPSHLEPVTNVENILRGSSPVAANARKTVCDAGHALTSDNIRRRSGARAHHRECLTCHRRHKAETKRRASGRGDLLPR